MGKRELLFFMTAGQRSSNKHGDLSLGLSACVLKLCGLPSPQSGVTRAATGPEPPKPLVCLKGVRKLESLQCEKPHFGVYWGYFPCTPSQETSSPGMWLFRGGVEAVGLKIGRAMGEESVYVPHLDALLLFSFFFSLRNINL